MKKKRTLKKGVANLLTLILIGVMIFSAYKIYAIKSEEAVTEDIQNEFKFVDSAYNDGNADKDEAVQETYAERFNKLKDVNSDFKGWIVFENGLLDLPFVKYSDNSYYLNKNFKKEYSSHGTVFQDMNQSLESQNITLYGHYVYNNTNLMFSPLTKLTDKENYEDNKKFSLMLENSIRHYEVMAIFKYSEEDEAIYQIGNFDENTFRIYKDYIDAHQLYDTGIEINMEDKLISLQTCVRNEESTRWVVVGKLISEETAG